MWFYRAIIWCYFRITARNCVSNNEWNWPMYLQQCMSRYENFQEIIFLAQQGLRWQNVRVIEQKSRQKLGGEVTSSYRSFWSAASIMLSSCARRLGYDVITSSRSFSLITWQSTQVEARRLTTARGRDEICLKLAPYASPSPAKKG